MNETKRCSRCQTEKALTDFKTAGTKRKGHQRYCITCQSAYGRELNYGITEVAYQQMLRAQFRSCAICRIPFGMMDYRNIHVDHDHATGAVRGLLCIECNHGLGRFEDNIQTLENAVRYLKGS